uniref:DnaJ subfamily C member 24 n=1 Tax=Anthurium amnicola TaxID=1678845 RepID=A0A1D1YK80_9ARAE
MLHPDKDSIQETYYDVLHVEESASYDEIRACYKTAILNSHPDKLSVKRGLEHHQEAREGFLRIQKAWEVLGNAESRALYDRELRAMGPGLVFAEEVKLKQMDLNDSGDAMELFYPCRCGDNFSITLDELEEMGVLLDGSKRLEIQEANVAPVSITIPCSSCSLNICLMINDAC